MIGKIEIEKIDGRNSIKLNSEDAVALAQELLYLAEEAEDHDSFMLAPVCNIEDFCDSTKGDFIELIRVSATKKAENAS